MPPVTTPTYEEYQNFDQLFFAAVTKDDATAYTAATPKVLAPAGEISVKTERKSDPKYYDGRAYIMVAAEGTDEITLTIPGLPISQFAEMLGKVIDPITGAMIDTGKVATKYFAIGYRLQFTDGTFRYVWRHKGVFVINEESAKTYNNTTDTSNLKIIFRGIPTHFKFDMPDETKKPAKQIVVDERDGLAKVDTWFTAVVTPENILPVTP